MEEQLMSQGKEWFDQLIPLINGIYAIALIIAMTAFNYYIEHEKKATKLDGLQKIPRLVRLLIVAIILGGVFIYFFEMNTKQDIGGMIIGLFVSMFGISLLNKKLKK